MRTFLVLSLAVLAMASGFVGCEPSLLPPIRYCKESSDCSGGICSGGICVQGEKRGEASPSEFKPSEREEPSQEGLAERAEDKASEGSAEQEPTLPDGTPEVSERPEAERVLESQAEKLAEAPSEGQKETVVEAQECEDGKVRPCLPAGGGCTNVPGKGLECVGTCVLGEQGCTGGRWGRCEGGVPPAAELCDLKDNDCDGKVDEGLARVCYTGPSATRGKGLCKDGSQPCVQGRWGTCVGQIVPSVEELCNNQDDDCNGAIDDNILPWGECYTASDGGCVLQSGKYVCTAPCKVGQFHCIGGKPTCQFERKARPEICNNQDDDCDGQVDEDTDRGKPCYTGASGTQNHPPCQAGLWSCSSGVAQCIGQVLPKAEVLCNGIDENCDGQVDETSRYSKVGVNCVCGAATSSSPVSCTGGPASPDCATCRAKLTISFQCLKEGSLFLCKIPPTP